MTDFARRDREARGRLTALGAEIEQRLDGLSDPALSVALINVAVKRELRAGLPRAAACALLLQSMAWQLRQLTACASAQDSVRQGRRYDA